MKVLFVEPMGFSGIFRHAMVLGRELVRQGLNVEMVTSRYHAELATNPDGVIVHQLLGGMNRAQPVWRRGLDYLSTWPKFITHVLTARADLIHFHQFTTPYLDAALLGLLRLMGQRLALSVHENEPRKKALPPSVTRLALRMLYRLPQAIVTHSHFARDELVQHFDVPGNKITVIPLGNFFDYIQTPCTQAQARQKLELPAHGSIILFFGTIRDNKGLHILLDALEQVNREPGNWHLVIAGEMERKTMFDKYAEHIRRSKLDERVIVRLGYVPADLLPDYFCAADIIALPYLQVYQSGVVQLAYAFERPVIASQVGGLAEVVIEGETGYLVPPGDPNALAHSLLKLMKNPTASKQLGKRGKAVAETIYSWDKIARQTASLYSKIMGD